MNLSEALQPSNSPVVGEGQALPPGSMLEDFEVTQILGLTGYGVLYLARHVADGNTVCIKEYLPAGLAVRGADDHVAITDPQYADAYQRGLEAFASEALALSQFNHPHLLHVSCVWEANGTAYRAMPHTDGATLLAWRTGRREPASQDELQALQSGLLQALEMLHGAGLAHGQVAPDNILMLTDGKPLLMDFGAVHHALQSDLNRPYVDAYADPAKSPMMVSGDLHAVAAVLHFAVSGDWQPIAPGDSRRYPLLADVLVQLSDSTSALGYSPEFLSAIDIALACSPANRPHSVADFRALFDPKVATAGPEAAQAKPRSTAKRPARLTPPPMQALNSTESVLALLANFDRGPTPSAEDVEPFESPVVPTLTEEAEPSLPPIRTSLFDAMDAGEPLPMASVGYSPVGYKPMPRVRRAAWRRYVLAGGIALVMVAGAGVIGWQLLG